jgi:hypothetical protein
MGLPWWWGLVGLGFLTLWITTTSKVMSAPRIHPWPIVGLALVVATILAMNSSLPEGRGWLVDWYSTLGLRMLEGVSFERFALAAASFLFLCESANIIVRMMISGSDKQMMSHEESLKGGRILGPIERIFILAMGLGGEFLAVAAVVAAKGILRFPEISGTEKGTKAEYVLVGSFVSWGVALLCIPLLQ